MNFEPKHPVPQAQAVDRLGRIIVLRKQDWSDEHIQVLREQWDKGLSGSQIGAMIGKTRCSVIGKARRLNLPRREPRNGHMAGTVLSKRPRKPPPPRGAKPSPDKKVFKHLKGKPVSPKHYPAAVPLTDKPPIGIMQLRRNSCRAIVGHGPDGLAVYCGDETFQGKSFCEGHCAMYYTYRDARSA